MSRGNRPLPPSIKRLAYIAKPRPDNISWWKKVCTVCDEIHEYSYYRKHRSFRRFKHDESNGKCILWGYPDEDSD